MILSVVDHDSLGVSSAPTQEASDPALPMAFTGFIPVKPQARASSPDVEGSISQVMDRVGSRVRVDLDIVANQLRSQGINAEADVVFGEAAEKIVEVAKKKECDLIAMSTHGRNTVSRAFLGSVTDKVIRTAQTPTLAITPEKAQQLGADGVKVSSILVPLDGSDLAESVLPFVVELAKQMSLTVDLCRAVNMFNVYTPYSAGTLLHSNSKTIESEVEAEAKAYLAGVAENLRNQGLEARCGVMRGVPASAIIDVARALPENLIVMASHGRSGFRRLALGSVTDSVIRSAGDPVLVIPSTNGH